jgi:hypothetical protein
VPKKAMMVSATMMNGMAAWASASIITASSNQPRKCAARNPSVVPSVEPISVPASATDRLTRIEASSRLNTSCPTSSVPSTWCQVPPNSIGGASRARRSSAW